MTDTVLLFEQGCLKKKILLGKAVVSLKSERGALNPSALYIFCGYFYDLSNFMLSTYAMKVVDMQRNLQVINIVFTAGQPI